jgi:hypothetical protein
MPDYHRVTLLVPRGEGDAHPQQWAYAVLLQTEPYPVVVEHVEDIPDAEAAQALIQLGNVAAAADVHEETVAEHEKRAARPKPVTLGEQAEFELVAAAGISWAERVQQMGESYGAAGGASGERRAFARRMAAAEEQA